MIGGRSRRAQIRRCAAAPGTHDPALSFLDRLPLRNEDLMALFQTKDGGEPVGGSGQHKADWTLRQDRLGLRGRLRNTRVYATVRRARRGIACNSSRPSCVSSEVPWRSRCR